MVFTLMFSSYSLFFDTTLAIRRQLDAIAETAVKSVEVIVNICEEVFS